MVTQWNKTFAEMHKKTVHRGSCTLLYTQHAIHKTLSAIHNTLPTIHKTLSTVQMVSKVQPHSVMGEEVSQRFNPEESHKTQKHREGNTCHHDDHNLGKDNMSKHQTIASGVETKQIPNNIQGI